jgi:uncharacterized protein YwqG
MLRAQIRTEPRLTNVPKEFEWPAWKGHSLAFLMRLKFSEINKDDFCEMMWGDCGILCFWIRKDDLAARNFDDVWMILQCS